MLNGLVAGLVAALLGTGVAHAPAPVAVAPVARALRHTVFAEDLGCTAVDVGQGQVLTAKHCVDDLPWGSYTDEGRIVYVSADRDFAILFDPSRTDSPPACMRAPRLGEHLYAVGYPVQLVSDTQELTVTDGVFAGPRDSDGQYRITAPIYYGNSGGGVWGNDGCLLGLSVSGILQMPGMNYIVASQDIVPWLPRGL
jgi:S1-C subfamily serine protease